jgi:Family of unknown function (DUF6191)
MNGSAREPDSSLNEACTARAGQERLDRLVRLTGVAFVFFMTLPGLVVGLVALAAVDRLGWWVSARSGLPWYRDGHRPAPAPGLDELQALFHASKRHAIEQRKLELVLRDDEHDGAPPRVRVDLDANRVVITGPIRPSESWTYDRVMNGGARLRGSGTRP